MISVSKRNKYFFVQTFILIYTAIVMSKCICTITDNNFIIGAMTMIYSFLKNNKWFDGDIIIFYSDTICPLSYFNRNKIEKQFINQQIKFQKIDESKYQSIMNFKLVRTSPSIFTFEAFELDYDRVVFLDADMVIIQNVNHLFDITYELGVTVDDWKKYQKNPTLSKIHHKKNGYEEFNGGLFSIGRKLLNRGTRDKLIEHAKTQKSWKLWDQSILNSYFHKNLDQIYYFSSNFNSLKRCFDNSKFKCYKNSNPYIIHYVGKKPWDPDSKEHYMGKLFNYSQINDVWKKYNIELNQTNVYNQVDNHDIFLVQKGLDIESKYIKELLNKPFRFKSPVLEEFYRDHNIYELLKNFLPQKIKIPFKESQTIAVVGNGDCLLNQKMGRNIDSHNSVIRINDFSTDPKYVEDVGQKTSFILLNEYCITDYLNKEVTEDVKYIVLLNPREDNYNLLLTFYCYLHFTNDRNKDKLLLLSPSYRKKLSIILNYEYPSSGFFGVTLAKDIAIKHVSVYGFNIDDNSPNHYQKDSKINYSLHKIRNEYLLYKQWASNNFVIYSGKTSISKPIIAPKPRPILRSQKQITIPQPKPEIVKTIPKVKNVKPLPKTKEPEKILEIQTKEAPEIKDVFRTAVYIYGTPYNVKQNTRFLRLFLNNNDFDLFIHFNIKNLSDDLKIIQRELKPKSYLFEVSDQDYSKLTKDWNPKLEYTSISDAYSLYKCNQLRKDFENENNRYYEYIIALNFNMTYMNVVNNLVKHIFPKIDKYYNCIFIPNSFNGYGINTNMAICHNKIMNVYTSFYKWIENAKNKHPLNMEYLLCKHLLLSGIQLNIIKFDYFYLGNKEFFASESNLNIEKQNCLKDWKMQGDINNIEYNTAFTREYYKNKLDSVNNILKLRLVQSPKYYLYNETLKKFLHVNFEKDVVYGCTSGGTLFSLDIAENKSRITLSSHNKYLCFEEDITLINKVNIDCELYLLKNGKFYLFQTIERTINRKNKYGKHIGIDENGLIQLDCGLEPNSKFLLMNEAMYRNHIRNLMKKQ